ncbi:MAG: hypothetical protein IJP89_04465 [Synergistaceae bacterium]|nr:hypothetical protein [Synergistaceae bacterium]MBR0256604.1 hypothetical protein [Synergistaceae bacterium]
MRHANYSSVSVRWYLDNPNRDAERILSAYISSFTCPKNHDIERFLKNNAVEFTKKQQSVTYLVLTEE